MKLMSGSAAEPNPKPASDSNYKKHKASALTPDDILMKRYSAQQAVVRNFIDCVMYVIALS
jgi:hypothetical protein